ncbi:MAG TPA: adenylate/guanylate cyclase domain-containing protein [Dongiaceae bacterium]
MERRLTAILAADVVGYASLMEKDEAGTYARLRAGRKELFEPEIHRHHGRIFKLMGDGLLAEFGSVVDAVECAVALQRGLGQRNSSLPEAERIEVRIGVNLGDVIVEGDDRYGDGVNIAARLEQIAEPGSVYVSGKVVKEVERRLALGFQQIGEQKMKNLVEPVEVYRVIVDGADAVRTKSLPKRKPPPWRWPAAAAVLLFVILAGGVAFWQSRTAPHDSGEVPAGAQVTPDKSSIAVLPFANMSDDPQQSYFADGIAEDLMTDLSHVDGFTVIARHSAFAYKGRDVDLRQVGRDLGVRYIVEGSVRRAGEQIRINVQLIDATTGGHEWADRYDGSMDDIFALQDHVTKNVVDALRTRLGTQDAIVATSERGTNTPEAYDAFLQGWEHYQRTTPADFVQAVPYFQWAIELDPAYSRAQAALAMVYFRSWDQGWSGKLGISADEAFRKARDHLNLAKAKPTSISHQVAGNISRSRGWYDDAQKEFQAAIDLDPSDSWSYAYLAYSLINAGKSSEAEAQIATAMRLDPHFPPLFVFYQGVAQFEQRRMEEASVTLAKAAQLNPEDPWSFVYLAASYAHLGREKLAKDTINEFSRVRIGQGGTPFVLDEIGRSDSSYGQPAETTLLMQGLNRADIPRNFDSPEFDAQRLKADEVELLVFGHRLHGRSLRRGIEHGASISPDGIALTFGLFGSGAATAKLDKDRLCFQRTATMTCGRIMRNIGGTKELENEYIWFLGGWIVTFSQVE